MNRKIKKVCKYRDDYRESKNKLKNICVEFHVQIENIQKKYYFNEREYADKLYQQRFNKKIKFAKR